MPKPSANIPWAQDDVNQDVPTAGGGTANVPNKEIPTSQWQSTGALYQVIFPVNFLNYKLNEITEWIDYFETTTDTNLADIADLQTPDVIDAGWVKSQAEYIKKDLDSSTPLVITSEPKLTDIFVSATGGGGDIEWAALDALPTDTKYLYIRIDYQVTSNSATSLQFTLGASDYFADPSVQEHEVIRDGETVAAAGTVGADGVVPNLIVPVDLRRLRFFWNENVSGGTLFGATVVAYLVGYGV